MPSAVKAEEEEVDTRSLLFGEEAPAHKFHATDDIGIDCLRLELSPCHLFCRGLENRRIGPVHVKLVCGMVHKGAEHAEKLAKAGLIPVLDAPFLQKDDVLQKTGLSNIGEIVAGQLLAELRLDKVRERIAELFVHRSGTDAFDELAVLDFLVVLEIIGAGLKQLRDGQHLRLFFSFSSPLGLKQSAHCNIGKLRSSRSLCSATDMYFPPPDVGQRLVLLDVFAAGGGETPGLVIPVLAGPGNIGYSRNAVITGLVKDHFQLDHLGGRGLGTFECD